MTIQEFYNELIERIMEECNVKIDSSKIIKYVKISKSQNSTATKTSLTCNILELINNFGTNIYYRLKNNQTLPSTSLQNGLSIIMKNVQQNQLHLPVFSQLSKPNRKLILQQDIINWIKNNGKCSYHIPPTLMQFFGHANPESYKEKRKLFDLNELNFHYQSLAHYLATPWMLTPKFRWLLNELDSFIVSISGYISFLQQQKEISAINHNSEVLYNKLVNVFTSTLSWKLIDIKKYLPMDPIMLISDMSASESLNKKAIDTHIKLTLDLVAAKFLAGKAADAVVAVDERHHDVVVHLATVISVNDLLKQIKHECTPKIMIPSTQWLWLQFWPKNLSQLSSLQYNPKLHFNLTIILKRRAI
ncbi:hypothetical protein C2G38_2214727 [Gigaspora rosea]|uniref:Uncharacterized protein n=1 Tax=Gigaspora rosea TaxID=44941 RepID=A0A397UEW9_9GLOM|nr:hypothetical protein C2G38_2214727 [Gigaspora rosea]